MGDAILLSTEGLLRFLDTTDEISNEVLSFLQK